MNFKALETAQKLRGGYYTPEPIAAFLSRWALDGGARSVLEPSCGDGVFFGALSARIAEASLWPGIKVDAVEIVLEEAEKADRRADTLRAAGAEVKIANEDFFRLVGTSRARPAVGRGDRQSPLYPLSILRRGPTQLGRVDFPAGGNSVLETHQCLGTLRDRWR